MEGSSWHRPGGEKARPLLAEQQWAQFLTWELQQILHPLSGFFEVSNSPPPPLALAILQLLNGGKPAFPAASSQLYRLVLCFRKFS